MKLKTIFRDFEHFVGDLADVDDQGLQHGDAPGRCGAEDGEERTGGGGLLCTLKSVT
jgi:hypothetical protein